MNGGTLPHLKWRSLCFDTSHCQLLLSIALCKMWQEFWIHLCIEYLGKIKNFEAYLLSKQISLTDI